MNLSIEKTGDEEYKVLNDGKAAARIVMDYDDEVREVVVSDRSVRRKVLELAVSHIRADVTYRTNNGLGGLRIKEHAAARARRSREAMDFDKVQDLTDLDDQELVDLIEKRRHDAKVIDVEAGYSDLPGMLDALVADISEEYGVQLSWKGGPGGPPYRYDGDNIAFVVEGDHEFTYWKNVGYGDNDRWNFHILPPYHPEALGKKEAFLINGATDVIIRGEAIYYVQPPRGSGVVGRRGRSFESFSKTKHPFKAAGKVADMTVRPNKALSAEGYAQAREFLVALLGLDDTYVAVSGGFDSNFRHPHISMLPEDQQTDPGVPPGFEPFDGGFFGPSSVEMMITAAGERFVRPRGRAAEPKKREAKGSENDMVWEYETLEAEGQLQGAKIPRWFLQEGWLEVYKNPEYRDAEADLDRMFNRNKKDDDVENDENPDG